MHNLCTVSSCWVFRRAEALCLLLHQRAARAARGKQHTSGVEALRLDFLRPSSALLSFNRFCAVVLRGSPRQHISMALRLANVAKRALAAPLAGECSETRDWWFALVCSCK